MKKIVFLTIMFLCGCAIPSLSIKYKNGSSVYNKTSFSEGHRGKVQYFSKAFLIEELVNKKEVEMWSDKEYSKKILNFSSMTF